LGGVFLVFVLYVSSKVYTASSWAMSIVSVA